MTKHKQTLLLLVKSKEILERYKIQNIRLTLRQLYYQLVSGNIIPNNEKQYKNLSRILTDARYSKEIDWQLIEDRVRVPLIPNTFSDVNSLIESAKRSYQLNRWQTQDYYVEVWCEKDALASVVEPITEKYQVPFCINRGYASVSAIYEATKRFDIEKKKIILYIGDFDASGLDMIRNIQERLKFLGADVQVIPIALTKEQIKKYKLPSNPAKEKDSRAKSFIKKYGKTCWEVDALKPDVLQKEIENNILLYLDLDKFNIIKEKENLDISKIRWENNS